MIFPRLGSWRPFFSFFFLSLLTVVAVGLRSDAKAFTLETIPSITKVALEGKDFKRSQFSMQVSSLSMAVTKVDKPLLSMLAGGGTL